MKLTLNKHIATVWKRCRVINYEECQRRHNVNICVRTNAWKSECVRKYSFTTKKKTKTYVYSELPFRKLQYWTFNIILVIPRAAVCSAGLNFDFRSFGLKLSIRACTCQMMTKFSELLLLTVNGQTFVDIVIQ